MQCTLFCTQGTCILIRTKKKQRRKILLSCTAFHHLLFSLFSSPYPCSCSFFFSSSFRISCTIFCATSQSCISDLVLRYSNLSRRISGEKIEPRPILVFKECAKTLCKSVKYVFVRQWQNWTSFAPIVHQ